MNDSEILSKKAARFREAILEVATGPGGMIIAFPRFDTRRPFQEGDFGDEYCWKYTYAVHWGGYTYTKPGTLAELLYGEDTLWTTGWFLWSQMLRYKATGESEALETARKCFLDLHNMFRLSGMIEPGCLGKPHGGRPGVTTSFDQSACPVIFYAMYANEYASPQLKAEAIDNLREHGLYFLRRNMIMNHHNQLQHAAGQPHPSTMKYLAAMYSSYKMTGDEDVREAVLSYLKRIIEAGRLPWYRNPYAVSNNLLYWGLLSDYWNATDLAGMADWISFIKEYWEAAKIVMDDEGLVRFGHYDTTTKHFTPYPDRWLTESDRDEWPDEAPSKFDREWISATSFADRAFISSQLAALALIARSHGLDDNAHLFSKKTLLRIEEDNLRYWWDDGKLPKEMKPLMNIFAPEAAAMWLTAYWMGRLQGVW